jgi:hypothetical protein
MLGFEPRVTFDGSLDTLVGEAVANHLLATRREALTAAGLTRSPSVERAGV